MKTVKINFIGFWKTFNYKEFLPYQILKKHYNLEISDKPDYIFCSIFDTFSYCKYPCIRIFWTSECFSPDMNIVDYALSIDDINFHDRIFHLPYFLNVNNVEYLQLKRHFSKIELADKKKFCNFIYSHEGISTRTLMFNTLSEYKKVDSAGKYLNNMDGFTPGSRESVSGLSNDPKIDFQRQYKYSIACENYCYPNYVTEKIVHAFMADTIPIYWGDSSVIQYFNPESFINCSNFNSLDDVRQRVIELDKNDDLYINMLNASKLRIDNYIDNTKSNLEAFLINIFEQDYQKAFRRPMNYNAQIHHKHLINATRIQNIKKTSLYRNVAQFYHLFKKNDFDY